MGCTKNVAENSGQAPVKARGFFVELYRKNFCVNIGNLVSVPLII